MKKADFLVVAIVLLLSIGFYVIYFSNNLMTDDDSEYVVEIYYKNELVYDVQLQESTNERVSIETKNNFLYIKIDSNGDGVFEIIKEPIATTDKRDIFNLIGIEYGHIHMEDANCENKLCLNMRIGKTLSTPIFCTNDILVKLVSEEYGIITG